LFFFIPLSITHPSHRVGSIKKERKKKKKRVIKINHNTTQHALKRWSNGTKEMVKKQRHSFDLENGEAEIGRPTGREQHLFFVRVVIQAHWISDDLVIANVRRPFW
jgi:hypothetical protein